MNGFLSNHVLRATFRWAARAERTDVGHVIDDDERLIRWTVGDLNEDEQSAILDHLADCPGCRAEVSDMVRAGALVFPDWEEAPKKKAPVKKEAARPAEPASPPASLVWTVTAVAAALLVGFVTWAVPRPGGTLELADRALRNGQPETALAYVEEYLAQSQPLRVDPDSKVGRLLIESGNQAARARLEEGDFREVLEIENRVCRHTGPVGEMANWRLQAERGQTAEQTLLLAGTLADYGYELSGFSLTMTMPTLDRTTERLNAEYARTLAECPQSVAIRLNYGQFLLTLHRFEEAREQFAAAQQLDPTNPLASLGLGLSHFELGQYEEALRWFEAVAAAEPGYLAGLVNRAICLERLERPAEAEPIWHEVLTRPLDAALRAKIERWVAQDE